MLFKASVCTPSSQFTLCLRFMHKFKKKIICIEFEEMRYNRFYSNNNNNNNTKKTNKMKWKRLSFLLCYALYEKILSEHFVNSYTQHVQYATEHVKYKEQNNWTRSTTTGVAHFKMVRNRNEDPFIRGFYFHILHPFIYISIRCQAKMYASILKISSHSVSFCSALECKYLPFKVFNSMEVFQMKSFVNAYKPLL